ncbi:MAG: helix-turn-helix transcriptional regulator [Bradyrhizobium sp.]|uniref:helix-turn-helix transcriptional regulator n=1 Tax=Bradyrhizobium sp. TaxID=376 RepID=UPI001C29AF64|nr:AraC family transcriptional regulator [Bradyrhizobium sp.]MBU6461405.1 helix-turn-helix transcriptional regulator [Pseudomonadota bacterium]MDE2067972.1 helix-turn-helix transcriptional regulator [Bradyrhizobium sp.]MDE2241528.1 helix-turn-helix transcriptional regulator [Bradyrhizobium sp.]MDE2469264.1 helix-turn-helix transcriptional regulator [Bradyrhizobium sp.]
MTDDEIRTLRVTTGFQGDGGLNVFREVFGREILGIEIDPLDGHPLDIDLTLRSLPGFAMASGTMSPMRTRHTPGLLDNDDLILLVLQSGVGEVSQYGRVATINEGEAVLTANGAEAIFIGRTATRVINFRLSRSLLAPYVADIDAMVARPIPRDNRVLQLMVGYARMINDQQELAIPDLRRMVATHMHSLAAALLGGDGGLGLHDQGQRAARLRAIKDEIRDRMGQHDLTIADVARNQQISESYIRQLLAENGTTFTDFVLCGRLARAHRMLVDHRYADHSISAVAYEAGFSDLSYFNRTFRRRYGATPSGIRQGTRHRDE